MNIPNMISMVRILLTPVFAVLYVRGALWQAMGVLLLCAVSDVLDGAIARRFNMVSTLGKILDPLADKITQFTLTVCLSLKHPQLFPVLALFVVKELFQLIAGAVHLKKGKMLPGALMAGKVCTTVLFISLIALVLFPNVGSTAVSIIAAVDTVFLGISFVSYILAYFGKNAKVQDLKSE